MLAMVTAYSSTPGMKKGSPDIQSISVLSFNKEGILFIGDSFGGKVFAVDLNDKEVNTASDRL